MSNIISTEIGCHSQNCMNLTDSHTCIDRKKLLRTRTYTCLLVAWNYNEWCHCHVSQRTRHYVPERFDNQIIAKWNWTYSLAMRSQRSWAISLKLDDTHVSKQSISRKYRQTSYREGTFRKVFFIYLLARNLALDAVARCIRTRIFQPVFHEYLRKSF